VETAAERLTELIREASDHHADLQDALVGAAQEADERLVRVLAQDAQAREGFPRRGQYRIGAPRQVGGEPGLRAFRVQIGAQGDLRPGRAGQSTPLQAGRAGAEHGDRASEDTHPCAVVRRIPAKRLPAVELLAE